LDDTLRCRPDHLATAITYSAFNRGTLTLAISTFACALPSLAALICTIAIIVIWLSDCRPAGVRLRPVRQELVHSKAALLRHVPRLDDTLQRKPNRHATTLIFTTTCFIAISCLFSTAITVTRPIAAALSCQLTTTRTAI